MFEQDLLNQIITNFLQTKELKEISKFLGKGETFGIRFLNGSLLSFFIYLFRRLVPNRRIIVVAPDDDSINKIYLDLSEFFEGNDVYSLSFPSSSSVLRASVADRELVLFEKLVCFAERQNSILLLSPEVLQINFPEPNSLLNTKEHLYVGKPIQYQEFIGNLLLKGFEKKDYVERIGDIAVRGSIVDFFPIGLSNPIRLEFFGDEIESIREFDIETHRSQKNLNEIEFITTLSQFQERISPIEDYFINEDLLVVVQPEIIQNNNPDFKFKKEYQTIYLNSILFSNVEVKSRSLPSSYSSISNFAKEFLDYYQSGYIICFASDGELLSNRLKDIVRNAIELEFEQNLEKYEGIKSPEEIITDCIWFDKPLGESFVFDSLGLVFWSEHQIFGRQRVRVTSKDLKKRGITLSELKELNVGDYVVHIDKGIAKFDGIQRINFNDCSHDCVRLVFADDDVVYLNLSYLYKLQKYTAEEGVVPKLSKLGTNDWERKKRRIKERLKDAAKELIKIYAERKLTKGFAFGCDTIWQKECEASFIYEDTIDQAKATEDVKKDMESEIPMDRLICGDVGFGKTEVAIRAAFKAVQSGKQVAVLVPTTILASQHEVTFKERLGKYPVIIESLSRFKSGKKTSEILEKLSEGKIDIIIGTHRLLSEDVKFKDLGLLIIDEEHRFGVTAKEKLRKLRVNIDTITLTATPIPRTLQFSLLGIRDMSLMETPPRNRLPIYTEVIYWNDDFIKDAIRKELARNGQVFFVVDKISRLELVLNRLLKLLPSAKIGVAHGQMKNSELEEIVYNFILGEFEILLTTKIIESGIDIPRANTIFIYNAQNFGLAELYQLRGRVGRKNVQAFCYLIIPPLETLTKKALHRLQALEEYTDLGSGFKLALRDLEIRGAGNLFGVEQSGFIHEIGYEMYHKILDEAVAEIKREEFSEIFKDELGDISTKFLKNEEIQLEVDFDAFLPQHYMPNEMDRFRYYKELYGVKTIEELKKVQMEIQDKFGKFPVEVENLFKVINLRLKALDTGIEKVKIKRKVLNLEFPKRENNQFYERVLPMLLDFGVSIAGGKFYENGDRLCFKTPIVSFNDAVEIVWRLKKMIKETIL
ncbi:MAG: transcription-repair coupling factor [Ignavibacteria bacterium]|nr:transcription-repair coupling factor [Ignavibacteria bacterium]